MSDDRVFIDTNVLVYGYDSSAGTKHQKARTIIADLWTSRTGTVSTQVLQEFFVTVTRKLPKAMDADTAKNLINDLLQWEVVTVGGATILDAIDLHKSHGYSFGDCLILAAAESGGCSLLLSEDFSPGQTIRGVTIRNPFV